MNEWKWVLLVTGIVVILSAAVTSWYLLTIVWLKALFRV